MVTSDDFVHCSSKAYNPTIYYLNLKALLVVGHKVVEQEAREGVGYRLDRVAALGASRIETFIRNLSCVNKEKLYLDEKRRLEVLLTHEGGRSVDRAGSKFLSDAQLDSRNFL